jgi:hypothetical protein
LIRKSNTREANTSGRARPEKVPSGPGCKLISTDPVAGPMIDPIRPAPYAQPTAVALWLGG